MQISLSRDKRHAETACAIRGQTRRKITANTKQSRRNQEAYPPPLRKQLFVLGEIVTKTKNRV
jgi:hypothetical protein